MSDDEISKILGEIKGCKVAYDGCHKIYICEDENDEVDAIDAGYELYDMLDLQEIWDKSCPLRFVSNWKLTKAFIGQKED